jgi:hypothetical protein
VKLHALCLTLFASIPLAAQDPPSAIVNISREQVKPGAMSKFMGIEQAAARFCANAPCPNPYYAITSITGPTEVWWINGFDSMDTLEKVYHAYATNDPIAQRLNSVAQNKSDLVFPGTNLFARFRDDMSFSSIQIFPHFLSITELHLRPGHIAAFRSMRIAFKAALERAGRPQWVYQVTSGAEDDTFLILTPGRTIQETQSVPNTLDQYAAVADLIVTSETRLYAVSPSLSFPSQTWLNADPDFWQRP